jgi:anti-sigma regulatory factor (Ser/Thr protein kinase)
LHQARRGDIFPKSNETSALSYRGAGRIGEAGDMPYYRCPACGSMSHSVAAYSTAGVCAVCSAELPDNAKLAVLPESRFGVNRRMRAGLGAPAEARRVAVALPLEERARERLALLVSELVTNSIRHAGLAAGDPIELELASEDGQVWVAVRDRGPGFDPELVNNGNGNGNGSGYGLSVVAALADDWGVEAGPNGCTVWCALDGRAITT